MDRNLILFLSWNSHSMRVTLTMMLHLASVEKVSSTEGRTQSALKRVSQSAMCKEDPFVGCASVRHHYYHVNRYQGQRPIYAIDSKTPLDLSSLEMILFSSSEILLEAVNQSTDMPSNYSQWSKTYTQMHTSKFSRRVSIWISPPCQRNWKHSCPTFDLLLAQLHKSSKAF